MRQLKLQKKTQSFGPEQSENMSLGKRTLLENEEAILERKEGRTSVSVYKLCPNHWLTPKQHMYKTNSKLPSKDQKTEMRFELLSKK